METGKDYERIVDVLTENIRETCRRKKISITRMESELGFSPGLISRWSKTKTSPAFDKIYEIAGYLGVTINDLAYRSGENNAGADWQENEAEEERFYRNGTSRDSDFERFRSESGRSRWEASSPEEKGMAEYIMSPKLFWQELSAEVNDRLGDISPEQLFENMYMYQRHYAYYAMVGEGAFLAGIQINEERSKYRISVFVKYSSEYPLEMVELDEGRKRKLLKNINPALGRELYEEAKQNFQKELFRIVG